MKLFHASLIVGSAALVGLLALAPTKGAAPAEAQPEATAAEPPTVENEIDAALAAVNGAQPMQGILALREIAAAHPDNFRAQYHLGKFAAETGQWEKVIERFELVAELDPSFAESHFWLGKASAELKQYDNAKKELKTFIELEKNNLDLVEEAHQLLNHLN